MLTNMKQEKEEDGTEERRHGPPEARDSDDDYDYYTNEGVAAPPVPPTKQMAKLYPVEPVVKAPPPPLTTKVTSPPAAYGSGPALPRPQPQAITSPAAVEGSKPVPSTSTVSLKKVEPSSPGTLAAAPAPGPTNPASNRAGPQGFLQRLHHCVEITPENQRLLLRALLFYAGVAIFFLTFQCPLSQLDVAGGGCYTFWGYKAKCDTVSYTYRPATLPCRAYASPLQCGAAFSVMNIVVVLLLGVLAWKINSDMRHQEKRYRRLASSAHEALNAPQKDFFPLGLRRWVLCGLLGATFVFQLISFSLVASLYSSRPCQDKSVLRTTAYGTGFGLLLTTWCLTLCLLAPMVYMALKCP